MKTYRIKATNYWNPREETYFWLRAKSLVNAHGIAKQLLLSQWGTAASITYVKEVKEKQ